MIDPSNSGMVLSHFQVKPLLDAQRKGQTVVEVSPDLGLSTTVAQLGAACIRFPLYPSLELDWRDAAKILRNENACYTLLGNTIEKIQTFSELTNRAYSLYPTASAPTLLVAGFPMHRIKDSDPHQSALAMVKTLAPIKGVVLDTCTGLGYTAIRIAGTAHRVVTIELDPAAQEIARQNPWSQALFENPVIEQRIGDSFEIVSTFAPSAFDSILHDPPTMSLAGELYSQEFYHQLYRVLNRSGKLFHYIGDPDSKFGANITRGVIQRLKSAGFKIIKPVHAAFGLLALK